MGVDKAVITNVVGFMANATAMSFVRCNAYVKRLLTRIWNGCDDKTLITSWATNILLQVPPNIRASTELIPVAVVVTKTQSWLLQFEYCLL